MACRRVRGKKYSVQQIYSSTSRVPWSTLSTIGAYRGGIYRYRPRLHSNRGSPRRDPPPQAKGRHTICTTRWPLLRRPTRPSSSKRVDVHDLHFSFGGCLSEPIPVTGHKWRPIRTPIPLAEWRTSVQPRNVFTTVMNWTSYKPLSYGGQTYGQKDAEFVKFLELPGRVVPAVLGLLCRSSTTRDGRPAIRACHVPSVNYCATILAGHRMIY